MQRVCGTLLVLTLLLPYAQALAAPAAAKNQEGKTYQLVMLRHGESVMNTQKRFSGWGDTHLTEKGVSAALKVGELLKKEGIPLTRSIPHASVELSKQLGRLLRAWI